MKIIGICGSSGSGKSTVCRYFLEQKIPVLDCDEIYHDLVNSPSECLKEIGKEFGFDLIENGRLNRKKLGKIVFSDRKRLELLNEISHRHVILSLEEQINQFKKQHKEACIIDAPMLFEAGLDKRCDMIIAVISDEASQLKRICERDGIDCDNAKKRLSNQKSAEELKERADFIIENNGTIDELKNKCNDLLNVIFTKEGE